MSDTIARNFDCKKFPAPSTNYSMMDISANQTEGMASASEQQGEAAQDARDSCWQPCIWHLLWRDKRGRQKYQRELDALATLDKSKGSIIESSTSLS